MRKIIAFAVMAVLVLAFGGLANAATNNLIKNPRFDTGNLHKWKESSPGKTDVLPATEQYLSSDYSAKFTAWNTASDQLVTLTQGISVTSDLDYTLRAHILNLSSSEPLRKGAYAWASLDWYTAEGGSLLGSISTNQLISSNDSWELFKTSGIAPSSASYAVVSLNMFSPKLKGGTYNSVYFDNIRVTAAPEPVSSALFLIGGTLMAVRQYRKRRKA